MRASAFTDADQSFAVIATIVTESHRPAHFLRVAAKNGTLFVQATMVVRGEQQLLDGSTLSPAAAQEPPAGVVRS